MKILHRYTQAVLFEDDAATIKVTLENALKSRADLSSADLSYANLSYANLSAADLSSADLSYANLSYANLSSANLSYADLSSANLSAANLSYANLSYANLSAANLSYANLSSANLSYANLSSAKIDNPQRKWFWICPEEGSFTAYKKVAGNIILTLRIPAAAKRTCNLINRKCRASMAKVVKAEKMDGSPCDKKTFKCLNSEYKFTWTAGEMHSVDNFDDRIQEDCAPGLHFFITKEEAKDFSM